MKVPSAYACNSSATMYTFSVFHIFLKRIFLVQSVSIQFEVPCWILRAIYALDTGQPIKVVTELDLASFLSLSRLDYTEHEDLCKVLKRKLCMWWTISSVCVWSYHMPFLHIHSSAYIFIQSSKIQWKYLLAASSQSYPPISFH